MPIEIKELVITAVVGGKEGRHANVAHAEDESHDQKEAQETERSDVVAECVDRVMEILRHKMER